MRPLPWRYVLTVMLIFGLPAPAAAQDAEWQPEFLPAEGDIRQPDGALKIALPAGVGSEVLQWLALELDTLDVSQLVQLETSDDELVVVLNPPQALNYGAHQLRLVQYTPEGDIVEKGSWQFEVRQSNRFREAGFASNAQVEGSYRAAERQLVDAPKQANGSGTLQMEGRLADSGWEASGALDVLYDSQGVQISNASALDPRTGREVDIGNYLLTAKTENLQALVGHHALSYQGLLMQDFHRRGASFTAKNAGESAAATAFTMRTEPISGAQYGFGVGDSDHRVSGAVASLNPIPDNKQGLTLTAGYLTGEGFDQSGVSVSGDETPLDGDGWSLAAESRLAEEKVKVRGEYAETTFDFDGGGDGFTDEDDKAGSLLVQFTPWQDKVIGEKPAAMELGVEYQQIGLFFHSLANPGLPSDRELSRVFGTLQIGGFALQATVGRETDNVDDSETLPTLQNELTTMTASYTPELAIDDEGNPQYGFFGQPSFSAGIQYNTQRNTFVPAALAGSEVDQRIDYSQIAAYFQYETWSWNIGHGAGWTEDLTDFSSDQRNRLSDLGLNLQLGERVFLSAQAQYNSIYDRDLNVQTRSVLTSLNAEAALIPNKLTGSINFSLNHDEAGDDSQDLKTQTVGVNINWQVKEALENRPGLTLWLRGEQQTQNDRLDDSNDSSPYQIFMGATIAWPVTYPGAQ